MLIKKDKTNTYLLPDIAYHKNKYDRGFDELINVFGADHHGYVPRLKASIAMLGNDPDKLDVEILQMVRLVRGKEEIKMSKRTGNAVTIADLVEEVGLDATRYFFSSRSLDTQLDFDMELATKQSNENPVYYAQYAHARMCSIERQAKEAHIEASDHYELLTHEKEIELVKHINEFRNEIIESAKQRAPHKIANYIQRLAQLFHSFYNDCYVIDENNKELSSQRLALVLASQITLKNALNLIGVEAPEKM